MGNPYFRFKQFTIFQDHSAMKVGTDGVLLGAWADVVHAQTILDIGTGTGIIALMLAQRSNALIEAVEIDQGAARQAQDNIDKSPWANRVTVYHSAFQDFAQRANKTYDLIVSNPPYFVQSLPSPQLERTVARHNELLPHHELLEGINLLLSPNGRFVGIFPYVEGNVFVALATQYALFCTKRLNVAGKEGAPVKRLVLEFSRSSQPLEEVDFSIRNSQGEYSEEYVELTKDFYLGF